MGKSSPTPPPAPDPIKTSQAQAAANMDTALAQSYLNMLNTSGPYGSVSYSPTGQSMTVNGQVIPQYQQTTTLSPDQQRMLDLQNQLGIQSLGIGSDVLGNVSNTIGQPFDMSGLPKAPGIDDFSADRMRVEEAMYSRLDPKFAQDEAAMQQRLANQGIAPGSDAYEAAMRDLSYAKNDARQQAVLAGGQEQSRMYGLGTDARQRAFEEQSYLRSLPINEYAALLGTAPGIQGPQFSAPPATGIQPPDVQGAYNTQYQGNLNAYNQQTGTQNANMGGLYGLGAAGIMALSDRRMKENIKLVKIVDGINLYDFNYIGKPQRFRGVMAQEVRHIPGAVHDIGGLLHVDYSKLPVRMEAV